MTTEFEINGDIIIAALIGDIVASRAETLRSQLMCLARNGHILMLLAMDGIRFMDSSGLKLCMELHLSLAEAGGALVCASPSDAVSKLLDTTRASEKLNLAKTREDGLSMLEGLSAKQHG